MSAVSDLPDTKTLAGLLAEATPGPWVVDPDDPDIVVIRTDEHEPWWICRLFDGCGPGDAGPANARLIALAPDLAARVIELEARITQLEAAEAALGDRT